MMSQTDLIRVAELQLEADGQVSAAEVELEGAQVALERAQELIAHKAGATRTMDDPRLRIQLAEAKLETAKTRRNLLGDPLFDAVGSNRLWVHVAVYVGDLQELNLQAAARLYDMGVKTNAGGIEIQPVEVPFSTSGTSTAADLYYRIPEGASVVVLAILASMVVALTLTPALALILFPKAAHRERSPISRALQRIYRGFLPGIASHPLAATILVIACLTVTAFATPFLAEEFLPNFKETDFLMHWVEKPGTSLEAMDRITIAASRELRSIPHVRNFGAQVGRAEVADEVVGVNFTELWISIEPTSDYEQTIAKIQKVVDGYPGLYRDLLTYLKERIKEVLTGASKSIVVRIYGPDLAELRAKASEAAHVMESISGVAQLKVEPQVLVPQLAVQLRPEAAARFGVTPGMVRSAATTLSQGTKVGEVFEDQKSFAVAVIGTDAPRENIYAFRELLIDAPGGMPVPLEDVADIFIQPAPNEIKHEGASRRIDVTCNVAGRSLGDVAREIEEKVKALTFKAGYFPEFLGEYTERQHAQRRLAVLAAFALFGVLLLLHVEFDSFRLALLVFLTLPFALIGGVAAAFIAGGVLSLGSLVGFVTVLGIAARNGIMLVSHYQHLQNKEGVPFDLNLIVRGAEERLAPILMTALCAGLGLIPLIIAGNKPGHEIEFPMAIVILGGLVTSTILNLLVVPALFWKFGSAPNRPEPHFLLGRATHIPHTVSNSEGAR